MYFATLSYFSAKLEATRSLRKYLPNIFQGPFKKLFSVLGLDEFQQTQGGVHLKGSRYIAMIKALASQQFGQSHMCAEFAVGS